MIRRDLESARRDRFDVAIVGGGIHGAMVALEAVRRGLRPVLLERADFAAATTQNSLRIVHGGLRYLQSADVARFRESVAERRWLLRHFPDLVVPLECVMPLDGFGTRRPWLLGPALWLNDLLSIQRNRGVATHRHLGRGELISAASLPGRWLGERRGLCARWFDAFAPDISRLVIETLHWACEHGAIALNYVEVESLVVGDHAGGARVEGVRARDSATGETLEVRAPVVMNAAGPWSREFARGRGPDHPELFVPSLAWNVLFDRPAPPGFAIAASPPARDGRVYFAVPWKGRLLVGTGHEPWLGSVEEPAPSVAQLEAFVRDLNRAIPGLELGLSDVLRVHAGLLPARSPGSSVLTSREVLIDHSRDGGPDGFFSLSGIKFTTARRVADKALKAAFPRAEARPYEHLARPAQDALNDPGWDWWPDDEQSQWLDALRPLLRQESVLHLDDLMLRRTWLADNPHRARRLAHRVCSLFDWDVARRKLEVQRVIASLARGAPIPLTAPVESRRDCELPGMVFRCS